MHLADALISVPIGGTFWAVSAVTLIYASNRLKREDTEEKYIPFMGVLGAFVFALQMINFAIPGTGSSGHFAGGFLLALLLNSHAAFIVISTVLLIQALFFADGGLLALGCNIFNLGFIPAYVIYPIFAKLIKKSSFFIFTGAFLSLLLGAIMVSIQIALSNIAALPFIHMFAMMIGIHLLIGIAEGLITLGSYKFICSFTYNNQEKPVKPYLALTVISLIFAGIVSLFASSNPDGLEWSVDKLLHNGSSINNINTKVHTFFLNIQEKFSFLPDYNFSAEDKIYGTSVAGIIGAILTIFVAFLVGYFINKGKKT